MKTILFALAMLLTVTACTSNSTESATNNKGTEEVAFEVAKNYFFKNGRSSENHPSLLEDGRVVTDEGNTNDQQIPASLKITTEEKFNKLFGMATVMGGDGKPTSIDFTKQFVLAIVLPVTDTKTEIYPVKVEAKSDSLFYTYEVKTGEKQTFSIQPVSIIILDKQYEDNEVKFINNGE